jgi:RNA polymerase sigma factor (sigma-70 family)
MNISAVLAVATGGSRVAIPQARQPFSHASGPHDAEVRSKAFPLVRVRSSIGYADRRMTEDEVAKLYREYGYVVFRRCVVYLGDPAAAKDAMQEVFVRALRGAPNVRGDAVPRTWLCRIVDHLCVEVLRRRRRNPVVPEVVRDEASQPTIEAAVGDDDRDSLLTVRRLLEGLDPGSLRLAVLYYVDELTQEELAQELGLSRRTIGKRLRQLLEHARTLLREERAS